MEVDEAAPNAPQMDVTDQDMADAAPEASSGDYNTLLAGILALRESDPKSPELRKAREAMAAKFPLSADIWEAWIDDESEMAENGDQKRYVLELCSRAVQDYLVPKLYASYVSLAIEYSDPSEAAPILDSAGVRSLCQKAYSACQWHIPESHLVWDPWRDFEMQLLEQTKKGEARQAQINRIRALYRDRLRVPHRKIEDTFSYYSSFETANDNANYEANMLAMQPHYNRGKTELEERESHEQTLRESSFSDDALFGYIQFEDQKSKDLQRIRCLYERALVPRCLDVALWDSFIVYLLSKSSLVDVASQVGERSTRNCPWSATLWAHRLRILEKREVPDDDVEGLFLQALSTDSVLASPAELARLLIARLEWLARRLKPDDVEAIVGFRVAATEGQQMFDDLHPTGDPAETLARFRIAVEARRVQDRDEVTKLWEAIIKKHGLESQFWLEYIQFERELGETAKCRSLFKQAINRNLDWPEAIFEAWLSFERESGDLSSLYTAMERVEAKRRQASAKFQAAVEQQAVMDAQPLHNDMDFEAEGTDQSEQASKKRKKGSNGVVARKKAKSEAEPEEEKPKRGPAAKPAPPAQAPADTEGDAKTVYVSKLPLDVAENQVRSLFGQFGDIRDIRLIKRPTIAFAYVEYATSAAAKKSCSLDGHAFEGGKAIKVAISNPAGKTTNTQQPQADRKELFIRNFPRAFAEADLQNVFEAFGEVTAVRILKFDDGQSRGIAFVEFASEEAAEAACSLHDTEIGGRKLMVEHSDPNARNKGTAGRGVGGGGGAPPAMGRGRGRGGFGAGQQPRPEPKGDEQESRAGGFAPRGGSRPGLGAPGRGRGGRRMGLGAGAGPAPADQTQEAEKPATAAAKSDKPAAKSNNDFRQMFIKSSNNL